LIKDISLRRVGGAVDGAASVVDSEAAQKGDRVRARDDALSEGSPRPNDGPIPLDSDHRTVGKSTAEVMLHHGSE